MLPGGKMAVPDALVAALKKALATYGHTRLELEFRIGRVVNGKFVPGVTKQAFDAISETLATLPQQHVNTTETIYRDCKRILDHDSQTVSVLHKKRIHTSDADAGIGPWNVRASISLEEPGALEDLKGTSTYERVKRRVRYSTKGWAIDLTRVASNLPQDLDSDSETYEVEIELLDVDCLFTRTVMEVLQWGFKISKDMIQLT